MKLALFCLVGAILALSSGVATAGAAPGGNSPNVGACSGGGWQHLRRADGGSFTNQGACVAYAARGGTFAARTQAQIDCESVGGSYGTDVSHVQTGSVGLGTLLFTCNGAGVSADLVRNVLVGDCAAAAGAAAWNTVFVFVGTQGLPAFGCWRE